jgi:Phage integrase family
MSACWWTASGDSRRHHRYPANRLLIRTRFVDRFRGNGLTSNACSCPTADRVQDRAAWGARASRAGRVAAPGTQPHTFCPPSTATDISPASRSPGNASGGRAALDDVRIHDLRHSFASIAVSGGDSLYLVGKVLGHRQSRTTERYVHLKDDPVRAVVIRLRVSRAGSRQLTA